MTSDNSKSQIDIDFLDLKMIKNQNSSFTAFEIQFKIRDLRLYYSTVQLMFSNDQIQIKLQSKSQWNMFHCHRMYRQ